jgi:hypothetical protein
VTTSPGGKVNQSKDGKGLSENDSERGDDNSGDGARGQPSACVRQGTGRGWTLGALIE